MSRAFLSLAAALLLGGTASPLFAQSSAGQGFPSSNPSLGLSTAAAGSLAGFGGALAVVDKEVLVGEGQNSLRPGMVYIYREGSGGVWEERSVLTAPEAFPGDGFGRALARDGTRLLVTAPDQNEGAGAAYILARGTDGEWTYTGEIVPPPMEGGERFGFAAAFHGSWAFVGAAGRDENRGAVYAFQSNAQGTWTFHSILTPSQAESGDQFGAALAAADGMVLVGAPGTAQRTGAVHAFRLNSGGTAWEPAGQVTPSGLEQGGSYGAAVELDEDRAVVGAPTLGGGFGAAFLFQPDAGGEWLETGRLTAIAGERQDGFGSALASQGPELWVGAPRARSGQGGAFSFRHDGQSWTEVRRIQGANPAPRALFGSRVALEDDVAAVSLSGADNQAGVVTIFRRDAQGEWHEAAMLASEPESLPRIAGGELECGEDGKVAELFPCGDVELLAFLPTPELGGERGIRLNDIWGWTDRETGKEYSLVGRIDGSSFVDISDPLNPIYVGQVMRTEGSPTAAWRDIKVYQDHAYIVADASGEHGMQVFDLTRLREFSGTPITWEPETTYHEIHSAHNIVINEESGFAYAVGASSGGQTCGGGLHMIDLRNPTNPTFAGCFSDSETGRASTGYSHDAQCVMYRGPHEEYQGREICMGANETALSIADVTNKANPVAISRASYPNVGYSHQGWFTEDHRFFYMNDELDEIAGLVEGTRTLIWDVSRLDDPQMVGEFTGTTGASDHNLYIRDNLMYQSNYRAGLQIIDISDPLNPRQVGHLDTAPFEDPEPGFSGSWSNYPYFESGVIAVSSIGEGLFLLRFRPPGRPVL
ncbi:MAG: choice-of-anchor B family protein [Gemmatimonadota bacterium]